MRGQLDFATRQLANPSAGVQQNLHDLGAMFGQFNKERTDKAEKDALAKERADERAFQREQADISNKRAEAMLSIQQQQAAQQAEKFGIDKATIAGTQAANRDLQNATQGLITPEQADVIRQVYEKNKGTDVVGMTNKAKTVYEASPTMQRQYLSGVNIAQEPTMIQVGVDALGQPKMVEVQGDMAKAQELKTGMLRDYDTKIQQDKLFAENQRQFGLKQALDEAQLAEQKRAHKAAELESKTGKGEKLPEGYMWDLRHWNPQTKKYEAKVVPKIEFEGLHKKKLEETSPSYLTKQQEAKDARYTKYLETVGPMTRPYSRGTWEDKGMPSVSSSYGFLPTF